MIFRVYPPVNKSIYAAWIRAATPGMGVVIGADSQRRYMPPLIYSAAGSCPARCLGAVLRQASASALRTVADLAALRRTSVAPRTPHAPAAGLKALESALRSSAC